MIPGTTEEDILGQGVTFVVTEGLLPLPLSKRSKNNFDLVALKRVKAPQHLLEEAEKEHIEKVCFELRVLLHEPIRKHPNIADIICIAWEMHGLDPNSRIPSPLLIMEHATFGDLGSYQNSNPLTWDQKKRICMEVACGLEVLHDSGIIHGDVKSENVLLFPCDQLGFRAKLSDFGGSLLDDDYGGRVIIVGTRIWSAPEISCPVLIDSAPKTDVYSFGLLSFRICIDGGNPFWALPIFDLDPDLSTKDTIQQIQGIKSSSNFLEMCLEYTHHAAPEFPLAEIMRGSLSQLPHQRQSIGYMALILQSNIQ
jgi:serine/threonine protein kinase